MHFTWAFSHHDGTVELSLLTIQYPKFVLAVKYHAQFFQAFLPQQFMPKESVFSLNLFKQLVVCFHVRPDHDDRKQFQLTVAWEKTKGLNSCLAYLCVLEFFKIFMKS